LKENISIIEVQLYLPLCKLIYNYNVFAVLFFLDLNEIIITPTQAKQSSGQCRVEISPPVLKPQYGSLT